MEVKCFPETHVRLICGGMWSVLGLFESFRYGHAFDCYCESKAATALPLQRWRTPLNFTTCFRSNNKMKGVFYWKKKRVVLRRVQNWKMENKAGTKDSNTYLRTKVRGQTYPVKMFRRRCFFLLLSINSLSRIQSKHK